MSDILHEIDEDLRRDRLLNLWKKYNKHILGLILFILITIIGTNFWKSYNLNQQMNRGLIYQQGLNASKLNSFEAAESAFEKLLDKQDIYATLARFQIANIKQKTGKVNEAQSIYENLSQDKKIEKDLRDLAQITLLLQQFDKLDPNQIKILEGLATTENIWQPLALNFLGLYYYKNGDLEKAKQYLEKTSDNLSTSSNLRNQATEILSIIKK
ncbi:MAG: tetratricopeptide repeat protein [Alphaproteobacteria bacterium]|nr:tetratricopeptide repeat protein [Alphaproteobacteria bacterium]